MYMLCVRCTCAYVCTCVDVRAHVYVCVHVCGVCVHVYMCGGVCSGNGIST